MTKFFAVRGNAMYKLSMLPASPRPEQEVGEDNFQPLTSCSLLVFNTLPLQKSMPYKSFGNFNLTSFRVKCFCILRWFKEKDFTGPKEWQVSIHDGALADASDMSTHPEFDSKSSPENQRHEKVETGKK